MMIMPTLPASNLLIGGRTLLLLPSLVAAVGLNEAIVLQQVRYRLGDGQQPRAWEGRRWARASLERWQERDFPFWQRKTVQRAFDSLTRRGLLVTSQPDLSRRDATKWYTIDFAALEPVARVVASKRRERQPPPRVGPTPGEDEGTLPPLPPGALLIDEPPLVIVVDLAVRVGLDEALLLQQIRYWLADERRPLVRDGRRWVCPRDVDMLAPFSYRARETLGRILARLERAGLLLATSRHNAQPGDRTKWYTIDFTALGRLTGDREQCSPSASSPPAATPALPQVEDLSISTLTECPDPNRQTVATRTAELSRTSDTNCRSPEAHSDRVQVDEAIRSLKGSQTDPQTEKKTDPQQQQPQAWSRGPVVVAGYRTALVERGITSGVASALVRDRPPTVLERQIAIYDWLRVAAPEDPRHSPGRLRKMIEEDWGPPPGYATPAELAARDAACARAMAERRRVITGRHDESAAAAATRRGLLERVGLSAADQALWTRVAQLAPVLPPLFRSALFHVPATAGEAAAVIFPDRRTLERASGPGHAATRASVAARIAALCHRPGVRVLYVDVPTVCAQFEGASRADAPGVA